MTRCAKIIVGSAANVGNVFYPTFTNVFFIFSIFNVAYVFLIFISTFITSIVQLYTHDAISLPGCSVFVRCKRMHT